MLTGTLLIAVLCPWLVFAEPIELSYKTWKRMLDGQWMVEFYAPWCSACQKFQPVWKDFSTAMVPKNIKVASVDTEQYSLLTSRFRIQALPTVYYVRDGVFWKYEGERSLKALKSYIDNEEWHKTDPVPFYLAPNSFLMAFSYLIADVPAFVKDTFSSLTEEYGWPTWSVNILAGIAVVFVGLGFGFGIISFLNTLSTCVTSLFTKSTPPTNQPTADTDDALLSANRAPLDEE